MSVIGYVTGHFVHPDNPIQGIDGLCILQPFTKQHKTIDNKPTTVIVSPVIAKIVDGTLVEPQETPGVVGAVVGWYQVTVKSTHYGVVAEFPIELKEEHTAASPLDLTTYAPVETPPGVVLIPSEATKEAAETAAADALTYSNQAQQSAAAALSAANELEPQHQFPVPHLPRESKVK